MKTKAAALIFLMMMIFSGSLWAKGEDYPELKSMQIPAIEAGSQASNPNSRLGRLVQLIQLYNQRFDKNGRYMSNKKVEKSYGDNQDLFIQQMRKEGALQQILLVGNDMDSWLVDGKDHFMRENVLIDEDGHFLALVSEKKNYKDDFSKALPQIYPYFVLNQWRVLIGVKGKVGFQAKMTPLQPDLYNFDMSIVTDLRAQTMMPFKIRLGRNEAGKWVAVDPQNEKLIRRIRLLVNVEITSMNGGVKEVQFDSRQSLADMPDPFLN